MKRSYMTPWGPHRIWGTLGGSASTREGEAGKKEAMEMHCGYSPSIHRPSLSQTHHCFQDQALTVMSLGSAPLRAAPSTTVLTAPPSVSLL